MKRTESLFRYDRNEALWGWLCDPETGERIRPATKAEHDMFESRDPENYCMGADALEIGGRIVSYEP